MRIFHTTLAVIALSLLTSCVPYPTIRWLVSPMSGDIRSGGRPATGVKITRHFRSAWYEKDVDQTTQTDNAGKFQLPGAWKPSLIFFIHQPVIDIAVYAEKDGKKTVLLQHTKMNYDRLGELSPYDKPEGSLATLSREGNRLHLQADLP